MKNELTYIELLLHQAPRDDILPCNHWSKWNIPSMFRNIYQGELVLPSLIMNDTDKYKEHQKVFSAIVRHVE